MNLLYYIKRLTIISILLWILYGVWGIFSQIILTPSPCGYGFGDALYQSRMTYIRDKLKINLPQSGVEILQFKCDGFQDPFIEMSFVLTKQQTQTVIHDFKTTYSLALEQKQRTVYENIKECLYATEIEFYQSNTYSIRPASWDFLNISLKKHNNNACILNLTVGDM